MGFWKQELEEEVEAMKKEVEMKGSTPFLGTIAVSKRRNYELPDLFSKGCTAQMAHQMLHCGFGKGLL